MIQTTHRMTLALQARTATTERRPKQSMTTTGQQLEAPVCSLAAINKTMTTTTTDMCLQLAALAFDLFELCTCRVDVGRWANTNEIADKVARF